MGGPLFGLLTIVSFFLIGASDIGDSLGEPAQIRHEQQSTSTKSIVNIIAIRPPRPETVNYSQTNKTLFATLDALKYAKPSGHHSIDVIVFPELFMGREHPQSIGANSWLITTLSGYAKFMSCYMVIPILDKDEAGVMYNAAVFMNRQGEVFAHYR
jgi:hypothetical protein